MLKRLVKFNMIIFVVLTAAAGYWLSFRIEHDFDWMRFTFLLLGVALISGGSFAMNQAQEWELDQRMPRTQGRPIPKGEMTPAMAFWVALGLLVAGEGLLWYLKPLVAVLGILTVVLYNGFYTLIWKPKWVFGAVPGAIPGAMPVVLGYALNNSDIFSRECVYAFLVMFLWQMPHFWALALRYKEDYRQGKIPTLPVTRDDSATLYFIGVYMIVYVALAVISPWIVETGWLYLLVVIPFSIKLSIEFIKFFRSQGRKRWLPFFLWTNFSMLAFLIVPILDRWLGFYLEMSR